MKGHIAQRYGELVKDLWSGSSKTIAPLKLRVNNLFLSVCQSLLAVKRKKMLSLADFKEIYKLFELFFL